MPSLSVHRWSFGGNRLQTKSETRLLADIEAALQTLSQVGLKADGNCQSLAAKQELLCLLLENEQMRLLVWLHPLDYDKKHLFPLAHSGRPPVEVRRTKDMQNRRSSNSNESDEHYTTPQYSVERAPQYCYTTCSPLSVHSTSQRCPRLIT